MEKNPAEIPWENQILFFFLSGSLNISQTKIIPSPEANGSPAPTT
jgi:hypothetical protein